MAKTFAPVPIWAFHGADDEIVPIARSKEMVDALKAASAPNVRFSAYPGVGALLALIVAAVL